MSTFSVVFKIKMRKYELKNNCESNPFVLELIVVIGVE